MLENIREIGIFMIAAQAVVHFAPGRQYEKYIRSVSGIVILLLFLRPFLQLSGAVWKEPVLGNLSELADMPLFSGGEESTKQGEYGGMGTDAGSMLVSRMEGEVKALLNRELEGEDYRVRRVALRFTQNSPQEEAALAAVEITMEKAAAKEESRIEVGEIVIGDAPALAEENVFSAYRRRFAALLGIEETKVEVRQDGRG